MQKNIVTRIPCLRIKKDAQFTRTDGSEFRHLARPVFARALFRPARSLLHQLGLLVGSKLRIPPQALQGVVFTRLLLEYVRNGVAVVE